MATRIGVGISDQLDAKAAFSEAAATAAEQLDGARCDLAMIFASSGHIEAGGPAILGAVAKELDPKALIGCGAGGVVGGVREIEGGAGAVVWALSAPGAEIRTHALT